MKYKTQGRKNSIVIRKDPQWENDTWKPTLPLTDKMAVEAIVYFKSLGYEIRWLSITEWETGAFN